MEIGNVEIIDEGECYDGYDTYCEDDKDVPQNVKDIFEKNFETGWTPEPSDRKNWKCLYMAKGYAILYKNGRSLLIDPKKGIRFRKDLTDMEWRQIWA